MDNRISLKYPLEIASLRGKQEVDPTSEREKLISKLQSESRHFNFVLGLIQDMGITMKAGRKREVQDNISFMSKYIKDNFSLMTYDDVCVILGYREKAHDRIIHHFRKARKLQKDRSFRMNTMQLREALGINEDSLDIVRLSHDIRMSKTYREFIELKESIKTGQYLILKEDEIKEK